LFFIVFNLIKFEKKMKTLPSLKQSEVEMKISSKTFNLITYISLAILILLLIGMLTKTIPPEYYIHALVVAFAIFFLRLILRILMIKQSKSETQDER